MTTQRRTIGLATYTAYGLTDMLGSGATKIVGAFSLYFYTTFCGLTAVQGAAIYATARLVDAIASPTIGHISDVIGDTAIGRRFGRRRFFLLLALPLLPSFALMWIAEQSFLYYLFTYIFFEIVFTMVIIPYETLAAEMTDDYRMRARFAGARILVGQVAAVIATSLPTLIIGDRVNATASTYLWVGLVFTVLIVASVAVTWRFTWERAPALRQPAPSVAKPFRFGRLILDSVLTLRVRAFRLHLGMYLGGYAAIDTMTAVFVYFAVGVLGVGDSGASTLLAAMSAAQFLSVAAFIWLTVRFTPGAAYRLAAALLVTALLGFLALGRLYAGGAFSLGGGVMGMALPIAVLAGLGSGGLIYIPWNTYNYIADVDEAVSGARREGVFAGVMTMFRKAVQAVAVMATGVILERGGLMKGVKHQPLEAQQTILAVLVGGPVLFLLFGVFVSTRFKLGRRTHAVLMAEIARFRAGDLTPPQGEAAAVVQDLTGQPVARLWAGRLVR